MRKLHIDIETFSSVDISESGVHKYVASPDFEILLIAYALDDEPVRIIDLPKAYTSDSVDDLHFAFHNSGLSYLLALMQSDDALIYAHNATFERLAFAATFINLPVEKFRCTMVHSAYCGLPLGLGAVSEMLELGDKGKDSKGKALIKFFCEPRKPTKSDPRLRNDPCEHAEKWSQFIEYCKQDVEAEREICNRLAKYPVPDNVLKDYALDQKINATGVLVDVDFVKKAIQIANTSTEQTTAELKALTGLDNPNSGAQFKEWLYVKTGVRYDSLDKANVAEILETVSDPLVKQALTLKKELGKSSNAKYEAMLSCLNDDNRVRGLFQFYGTKTGRWAGRLIQLQNLPQNHLPNLDTARKLVKTGDCELVELVFGNVPNTLSELIRTAFIAPEGKILAVCDFSAIEARVIAWLAGEKWRIEVFKTHGKIYEASASMMFGVPIETVTKGSPMRQKGKIAELALGYQGGKGALEKMGGASIGLSEDEMAVIVEKWRKANPQITKFWYDLENCAKQAVRTRSTIRLRNLTFRADDKFLRIGLPSGRELFYYLPRISENRFGGEGLSYLGVNSVTKKNERQELYGGKIAENVVQAVSRDLLSEAMHRLDYEGIEIIMHIHDEVVCEVDAENTAELERVERLMKQQPTWANGLPLNADGYTTFYYRKD